MSYPASINVEIPERIARWRPLVHWLLVIPHSIVGYLLLLVSLVVGVLSWFAIIFTGKLPQRLADIQIMVFRYQIRYSAYFSFLVDRYPPFAFSTDSADPGDYPAAASYSPALTGRNRVTVFFRIILIIPAFIFDVVIGIISVVCAILGFFAVLFTGRWPNGLSRWVIASLRVSNRLNAYSGFLTDEYPPFTTS